MHHNYLIYSSVDGHLLLLFSSSVISDSLQTHGLQHTRPPCPPPPPRACSNSCRSSQWCHPNISSSFVPFSSCLQFFPASESFPMSQLFTSDGQSIGASALALVLPVNIQDWFPLGLTDLISLPSKGFQESSPAHNSKETIFQCSAFFMVQLGSTHDYWKNHGFDYKKLYLQNDISAYCLRFLSKE